MKTKQIEIIEAVENCFKKAEILFKKKLGRPVIKFDIRGVRMACQAEAFSLTGFSKIRFNPNFMKDNFDFIKTSTVPHEVAHIVEFYVYGKISHSRNWKSICRALGGSGKTRHNLILSEETIKNAEIKNSTFKAKCKCKTHEITKNLRTRMLKGSQYSCRSCGSKLSLI